MTALAEKKCAACDGETPALRGEALKIIKGELNPAWRVVNEHHLEREFTFKNFLQALDFTNRVGALAEEQGHHPDIYLAWGKVKVTIWTHKVDALTESDFILAAKLDAMSG